MRVSFIHGGGKSMASYRYRAAIPAEGMGASINDLTADVLVFSKPMPRELDIAMRAVDAGRAVVADFCDDHFERFPEYKRFSRLAHVAACPTEAMARRIKYYDFLADPMVVPDPYEYAEEAPHCAGDEVLWFGHKVNLHSLMRVREHIRRPLTVVSNAPGTIPWSHDAMPEHFAKADIVILPATADYKSPNRAVEAIRQGCFVVAEWHPSLQHIPGIFIGDILEGIEWAIRNPSEANSRTLRAQEYVRKKYSPQTVASAWKSLCEKARSRSISAAGTAYGRAGSTLTASTSVQT